MRLSKFALLIAAAALVGFSSLAAQPATPSPVAPPSGAPQVRPAPRSRTSPHETITAVIGDRRTGNRILIVYGRPYTKDPRSGEVRKIWGGLVPFGKVWRTGADEATLLLTQRPLLVGDVEIPAGVVTLYSLPAADGSLKLIVNKQICQWGLQYDEKQDLGRLDMKRDVLEQTVDQFSILVENDPAGGGILKLQWENTQYSVPFTVKQ